MNHNEENKEAFLALIEKYLDGRATEKEERQLFNYYESFQKTQEWQSIMGDETALSKKMFTRLQSSITSENKNEKPRIIGTVLKYAAVLTGLLVSFYFFSTSNQQDSIATPRLVIPNEVVTIELDNGEVKEISNKDEQQIVTKKGNLLAVQKGELVTYDHDLKTTKETLVYNTLHVPYGKKMQLALSDGTLVHINAGSSLKYPVQFIQGQERKVFLEGEAYFDVAHDAAHPFVVNANSINIRALGTTFNVSAYAEDDHIRTVLVDGKVGVFKKEIVFSETTAAILTPNQSAVWNKSTQQITTEEVEVGPYIAWVKGKLIFKRAPFKQIRKVLERKYNFTIVNNNQTLDAENYFAKFDDETIEEVLTTLNESFKIDYEIINNQVIIN